MTFTSFRAAGVVVLAAAAFAPPALARGGSTPRPPQAVCGWSGGALADPASTQACLARRFVKPSPPPRPATPPADARSSQPPTS